MPPLVKSPSTSINIDPEERGAAVESCCRLSTQAGGPVIYTVWEQSLPTFQPKEWHQYTRDSPVKQLKIIIVLQMLGMECSWIKPQPTKEQDYIIIV